MGIGLTRPHEPYDPYEPHRPLELEPQLELNRPHILRPVGSSETRIPRLQARRIDRSVGIELRIAHSLFGRICQLQLCDTAVNHHRIEHVEHISAQLDIAPARETEIARDREVDGFVDTPRHVVAPGFQPDAAVGWATEDRAVELCVLAGQATGPGFPREHRARGIAVRLMFSPPV